MELSRSFWVASLVYAWTGWAIWGAVESDSFRGQRLEVRAGRQGPGFTRADGMESGVLFTNRVSASRYVTNQIYLNGSGVAAGDVDGDGWCDLFFAGLDGPNALYRNLGGWKFQEVASERGVGGEEDATGAALADLDGDGDLDLVFNTIGSGTRIFFNDGRGYFVAAKASGLNAGRGGMSLALADVEGDGDLDIYVANYRTDTLRDMPNVRFQIRNVNGTPTVLAVEGRRTTERDLAGRYTVDSGRIVEHGEPDVLLLNGGGGQFEAVPWTTGRFVDAQGVKLARPPYDWGLSAAFRDVNGDTHPDLYVCNDFESEDRFWLNRGDGSFQAAGPRVQRHTSQFSMGVDFADVNRDGRDDFLVLDMLSRLRQKRHVQVFEGPVPFSAAGVTEDRPQYSQNTLFVNRGDETYAEVAFFAGVAASEWSWTPAFLDVDLDGYEDLLITTGHELEMNHADVIRRAAEAVSQLGNGPEARRQMKALFSRLDAPNVAFRNRGDLTFEDVSSAWGFADRGVSHGLALADLDRDGDLDAAVNNLNDRAALYRNESEAPRVLIRLKGRGGNRAGIGASIRVAAGGGLPMQSQEMMCGGRYLSSDAAVRTFAAGPLTNRLTVEVRWRSGARTVAAGLLPNHAYEIEEPVAETARGTRAGAAEDSAFFRDVSALLAHRHAEMGFSDQDRQPLIPQRLSQLGPGLAWADWNADGWDDLAVGTGRGGRLGLFENDQQGGFRVMTNGGFARAMGRDTTGLLPLGAKLYAGCSNYEDGLTNGGCLRVLDFARGTSVETALGSALSTGPLAALDFDGDGDLDIFVGGRTIAGGYPMASPSLLLRNVDGEMQVAQRWESFGMVSGATCSDLDGDGQAELILASDWGPIRVLRVEAGEFKEATQELGLGSFTGWWRGVATLDADEDGRPDIVASNWGLNSGYRASGEQPLRLYYRDFDGSGTTDLIEARYDEGMRAEAPLRRYHVMSAALPFLREIAPNFDAYSRASVTQLFGSELAQAQRLESTTLESMLFLNRGGSFEAVRLPAEAQWAPAFGIATGDIDGDGHEDLFLAQNFFGAPGEEARQDAGRGLWLRGNGKGAFAPVSSRESGFEIYGEQRGCALADFNGDGRVDLAVGQNGAATKLFQNIRGRVGLRVRLRGPERNSSGVGAALRLKYGTEWGPVREIQGAAGYWSCNSAVQVFKSEAATGLWVRWPGGGVVEYDLPKQAMEVRADMNGTIHHVR